MVRAGLTIDVAVRLLGRQRIVLADGAARQRSEMARYLRSVGMDVRETGTLADTLEAVRDFAPALLAVDIDLPGAETGGLGRLVRYASERRVVVPTAGEPSALPFQPARTQVVYTCSPVTTREKLLSLLTPEVVSVLVTPCRPELMMVRLATLLDRTAPAATARGSAVTVAPGNSSLLLHRVLCPYHDTPVEARRYALRMGKMEATVNFFDIPVYTRAVGRAEPVDFHRVSVTVCPQCLFASADPNAFLPVPVSGRPTRESVPSAALSPSARLAVMAATEQRRQLAGQLDEPFFSEDRSAEQAVVAHRLALASARTLLEAGALTAGEALLKIGNGHLRLAHLRETLGDVASAAEDIEQASSMLREAFGTLPESAIPRTVYQVLATGIYLGQDRDVHPYLAQLVKLKQQVRDPATRQLAERYFSRGVRAWEEREHHRRPTAAVVPRTLPAGPPHRHGGDAAVPFLQPAA